MSYYPSEIKERLDAPAFVGKAAGANAVGTSASFLCGSYVRFYLSIGRKDLVINEVTFQSNGCGFAVATADMIAGFCKGKALPELGGLEGMGSDGEFYVSCSGETPPDRAHCREMCLNALRSALSDFRALQIEEFSGEKALICTCFGVEEETIERVIAGSSIKTVAEVTAQTNAGGGCGSCRMLIQEIIDTRAVGL